MRILWVLALFVLACEGGKGGSLDSGGSCIFNGVVHGPGEVFPAGDGCNSCMCVSGSATCTERACSDGGVDADPASCAASGGCPEGPECGVLCCGRGERCDNGRCVCGANPACGAGDSCEAAGPIGNDACGSICCGATGPCPQ